MLGFVLDFHFNCYIRMVSGISSLPCIDLAEWEKATRKFQKPSSLLLSWGCPLSYKSRNLPLTILCFHCSSTFFFNGRQTNTRQTPWWFSGKGLFNHHPTNYPHNSTNSTFTPTSHTTTIPLTHEFRGSPLWWHWHHGPNLQDQLVIRLPPRPGRRTYRRGFLLHGQPCKELVLVNAPQWPHRHLVWFVTSSGNSLCT